jgi:hypothetical protein
MLVGVLSSFNGQVSFPQSCCKLSNPKVPHLALPKAGSSLTHKVMEGKVATLRNKSFKFQDQILQAVTAILEWNTEVLAD